MRFQSSSSSSTSPSSSSSSSSEVEGDGDLPRRPEPKRRHARIWRWRVDLLCRRRVDLLCRRRMDLLCKRCASLVGGAAYECACVCVCMRARAFVWQRPRVLREPCIACSIIMFIICWLCRNDDKMFAMPPAVLWSAKAEGAWGLASGAIVIGPVELDAPGEFAASAGWPNCLTLAIHLSWI